MNDTPITPDTDEATEDFCLGTEATRIMRQGTSLGVETSERYLKGIFRRTPGVLE